MAAWPPAPVSGGSSVCGFCATVRGARVDFEFAAAQLSPKMLAQRLLVDREPIGDFGLGDANGRSALDEGIQKNGARMPGQSTIGRVASARCSRSRAAFVKYNGHSGLTGGATNFRQRTTLPVTSSISSINSSAIAVRSVSLKAHLPFRFTQTRDARALHGKRRAALRTNWNVRDSAATVVFVPDSKYRSRGTDSTVECAKKYGKPYCVIHYLDRGAIMGLKNMISQLGDEQSLNIAGPRESELPGAYDLCLAIFIKGLASYCGKNSDPKPTN